MVELAAVDYFDNMQKEAKARIKINELLAEGRYWVNNHVHVLRPGREKVFDEYIVPVINSIDLAAYITGVTVPKLNQE